MFVAKVTIKYGVKVVLPKFMKFVTSLSQQKLWANQSSSPKDAKYGNNKTKK